MAEFLAALYYLTLWLVPFAVAGAVEWVQESRARRELERRPTLHVVEGAEGIDREREAA